MRRESGAPRRCSRHGASLQLELLPPERSWVGEVKNPNYWRRAAELDAMARKHERARTPKRGTSNCAHLNENLMQRPIPLVLPP